MARKGDGIVADLDYSRDDRLPKWILTQKKTFTAWTNQYLAARSRQIVDLRHDFHDGLNLVNLIEEISNKQIKGTTKNPKIKIHFMENNLKALTFIKSQGIVLVGIGAEDMVQGELKLIMGLIWTLILRYQINRGAGENSFSKFALLEWIQNKVKPYGVSLKGLDSGWQDGKALYALTDSLAPGKLDFNTKTGDPIKDTTTAAAFAKEHFGIPTLMDPVDLVENPDELSIVTYLSYFQQYSNAHPVADSTPAPAATVADSGAGPASAPVKNSKRADPSKTKVSGIKDYNLNEPASFMVTCLDFDGNPTSASKPFVSVSHMVTLGPNNRSKVEFPVQVTEKKEGEFFVGFTPSLIGKAEAIITVEKSVLDDSPFALKVLPPTGLSLGVSDPDTLNNLMVDSPVTLEVLLLENGKSIAIPDESTFKLTDPSGSTVPITRTPTGGNPVRISAVSTSDGTHKLELDLLGTSPAPLELQVKPKTHVFDPSKCIVNGLKPLTPMGKPSQFSVFVRNSDGKPVKPNGFPFDVKLTPVSSPTSKVPRNINEDKDCIDVIFQPTTLGSMNVTVTLGGIPVKGSPFSTIVVPGNMEGAPLSLDTYGRGAEAGFAHEQLSFDVAVKASNGKPFAVPEGALTVAISPAVISPTVAFSKPNLFKVTYTPTTIGEHVVDLFLFHAPEKQLKVQILADEYDEQDLSLLKGPNNWTDTLSATHPEYKIKYGGLGMKEGILGRTGVIYLKVLDKASSKPVADFNLEKITFTTCGPSPLPSPPQYKAISAKDGLFAVVYAPQKEGNYELLLDVDGKPVFRGIISKWKSPPLLLPKSANTNLADPTKVIVSGLVDFHVNESSKFLVECKDSAGNPTSASIPTVKITSGKQIPKKEFPVKISEVNTGTFSVEFVPTLIGVAEGVVSVENRLIMSSPVSLSIVAPSTLSFAYAEGDDVGEEQITLFMGSVTERSRRNPVEKKKPLLVDPALCFLDGFLPEVPVGKPAFFSIKFLNSEKVPTTPTGLRVEVEISPVPKKGQRALGVLPKLTEAGKGNTTVEFKPQTLGPHKVEISIEEVPIKGSPFTVRAVPAGWPFSVSTSGRGLESGFIGEDLSFDVAVVDSLGKPVSVSEDSASVVIKPTLATESTVQFTQPNLFHVTYSPSSVGDHSVEVSLFGVPLLEEKVPISDEDYDLDDCIYVHEPKNWHVELSSNPTYKFKYSGKGTKSGIVGKHGVVYLQVLDKETNTPVTSFSVEQLKFEALGPAPLPAPQYNVLSKEKAVFAITYAPTNAGHYELFLDAGSEPVLRGLAVDWQAPSQGQENSDKGAPLAGAVAANCKLEDLYNKPANKPSSFKILAADEKKRKRKTGGEKFDVKISPQGDSAKEVPTKVTDNNNGEYVVDFVLPLGPHEVNVTLNGEPVKGVPHVIMGVPDSPLSATITPQKSAFANLPSDFTLLLKDGDGKPYNIENTEFIKIIVETQGDKVPATVSALTKDPENTGVYKGTFTPNKAGQHNIHATALSLPLLEEPVPVNVTIPPSKDHSDISGLFKLGHSGEPVVGVITAKDANGKPVEVGGAPFMANVKCPDGKTVNIPVKDNGDGTYDVEYTPEEPGEHVLSTQLGDHHIKGSPFAFDVEEDAISEQSDVTFTPVTRCSIVIKALNRKGELIKAKEGELKVEITGDETPLNKDIEDNGDGTYTINWDALPGLYKVAAKIRGRHVKGSPFKYNIPVITFDHF